MNYQAKFERAGEFRPDALIAGNAHLLVARKVWIAAGLTLVRGAILGKNPDGDYVMATVQAVPDLILAEEVNAAVRTEVLAYSRGDFNANAITFASEIGDSGPVWTLADVAEILRLKGIALLPSVF